VQTGTKKMTGVVPVTTIKTRSGNNTSGGLTKLSTVKGPEDTDLFKPSDSNTGPVKGSGGSAPKAASKITPTKKPDIVKPYKEIDD
jgi:hypothetical protein